VQNVVEPVIVGVGFATPSLTTIEAVAVQAEFEASVTVTL